MTRFRPLGWYPWCCVGVFLSIQQSIAQEARCTVCRDGSSVTLPTRALELPEPFTAVNNCALLEQLVSSILTANSFECNALQNVSTYCGCPMPSNACQLCVNGRRVENPSRTVEFEPIPAEIVIPTCGIAEAYLQSSLRQDGNECTLYKESLAGDCICATADTTNSTNNSADDDNTEETIAPTTQTNACGICPDGSAMRFPEKEIGYLIAGSPEPIPGFPADLLDDPSFINSLTCETVNSLALSLLTRDDKDCYGLQEYMAGVCGCPTLAEQPCDFCGSQQLPEPNRMVYTFQKFGYPAAKCEDVRLALSQFDKSDILCDDAKGWTHLCGCKEGTRESFRDKLNWVSRLTGSISMLGSCYIVYDVWKQYREGTFTVFNQLISAISICDMFFSLGFMLGALPLPKFNEYGESNGFATAHGTETTCKIQGFMIQFGLTGVFYQISLSTYYVLVIFFGWQERRIRKIAYYLHIPLLVGLILAFSAIPLFENCYWICYIPPPPVGDDARNTTIFAHVPIALSVAVTSINMMTVYLRVRRQFAAGNRWRISRRLLAGTLSFRRRNAGRTPRVSWQERLQRWRARTVSSSNGEDHRQPPNTRVSMERELFWQCVLYLGAFYVSYTFLMLSQIPKFRYTKPLWVVIMILAPLQGFWNFCTYVRPRAVRAYKAWKVRSWQRREERNHSSGTSNTYPSSKNTASLDGWKMQQQHPAQACQPKPVSPHDDDDVDDVNQESQNDAIAFSDSASGQDDAIELPLSDDMEAIGSPVHKDVEATGQLQTIEETENSSDVSETLEREERDKELDSVDENDVQAVVPPSSIRGADLPSSSSSQ